MLYFDVINQTLKRVDRFSPATDSVDYLQAVFDFKTDDWKGKTKYALFRLGTKTYGKLLDDEDSCIVPYEVLIASDESKASIGAKNKVFVSVVGVVGTVRIPTNAIRVDLETSGYAEMENAKDPTPTMYEQFIQTVIGTTQFYADEAWRYMGDAWNAYALCEEIVAAAKNDYSNALKGVASGAVVRVDDVSPVEHLPKVKIVCPEDVEPSTVTVTRCGKNLWNYKPSVEKNGVTITTDENGCITFNGACTNDFVIYGTIALNKGVYTLSDNARGNKPSTIDARTQVYIPSLGIDARLKHGDNPDACVNFELSKNATDVHIRIKGAGGFIYNNYAISPMLEVGYVATDFEPYNGTEYIPTADGTINGLTSVSPTMTLLTDTEGVTVECEYNQDVNKVFERLKNVIIALGGVV